MKLTHALGITATVTLFSFGTWLGCSSSSSNTNPGTDAGSNDSGTRTDTGTGSDTGTGGDTGMMTDGGTPVVSCQTYCTNILTACTGANAQYQLNDPHTDPPFSAMQQCLNMCGAMTLGAYDDGMDSVGCRQYHVDNIIVRNGDPAVHCPHAGPYGGAVCGSDRTAVFCGLATKLCTTANGNPQQFSSVGDCTTQLAADPYDPDAGLFDPNDLNHLNCFQYHLREAYTAPDAAEPDDSGNTVAQSHCGDLIIGDASPNPPGSCIQ